MAKDGETYAGCTKVKSFFRFFWKGMSEPFVLNLEGFDMVEFLTSQTPIKLTMGIDDCADF